MLSSKPMMTFALAVAFVAGTALAQRPAAAAPVAPTTGNPAKAVPLHEAVDGLVEMCTDYAGKAEIPFTEDQVKKYFPDDKTNSLGIVLRGKDDRYSVSATTTSGSFMGTIQARGSPNNVNAVCMFSAMQGSKTNFARAFSAAFDNKSGYVRDFSLSRPLTTNWRGPQVLASVLLMDGAEQNPMANVRMSRAPEQPLQTGATTPN